MKINKISQERKKYLKNIRINKVLVLVTQIMVLVGFLAIWEVLANNKIIDSFITSQPSRILKTFMNLSSNNLLTHIKVIAKVSEPFLVVLNSLPKVALGPIIIIWVGSGTPAIIVMAIAISLIVTILEILNGFLKTDKEIIKMAKTFRCTKLQLLTKIVMPSNIGTFINSLKVNIGLSLVGVISGEFLVSKAGLGYLIVYGGQVFKLDLVMTSVIILGILAGIMYGAVLLIEKFIQKRI